MEHIGIDLGATKSHIVVMSTAGEVLQRKQVATPALPSWLGKRSASRVVMEACSQSPAIARASEAAGHVTVVVPGNVVRALGVGARGIKTDDRDAEVLARASVRSEDLPSVHLRTEQSRARREQLATRALLLKARKQLALSIKSWLRGRLITLSGRANSQAFCDAARAIAVESPDGLPLPIELLLQSFEHLTKQVEKLDEELEKMAAVEPLCTRLMTVPGVGPVVALAFTTHIDEVERFDSSDQLASYLALVPGEATTGGKTKRTGTIKAGPSYLKALLVQSAWSMWRCRPNDPAVIWARRIADKRGKRIAIVALARKIATVLYAMWKHGTPYDPARASIARLDPQVANTSSAASEPTTASAPATESKRDLHLGDANSAMR